MGDVPDPAVKPARRSLLERFSVVWLVPIGALIISLAIAWQNYASRGPLIEIAFADAEGIRAGETELRYRDVPVGLVEDVTFATGLDAVLVRVRVDQDIAPYVDAESEFWVVRPQVTAQGVTGLSTVLSGVFIQGSWDTVPGGTESEFVGLGAAPVARPDVPGLQITLTSETGAGLLQGTPILYRGVQVGAIAEVRLADTGRAVLADAFIEAPYDELISSSTRFWNASGFSFSLGPQGATLDVSSLAALVSGGVALETLVSGGEPVEPGAVFELYDDEQQALSSVFTDPGASDNITVGFIFSGDVSGLSAGSAVEFRGIRVGEVIGVTGYIDEALFGDRRVRLLATAELDPTRLGVPDDTPADETLAFLEELIDRGVRARLARGAILVGGLKVELVEIDGAEEASLDRETQEIPIFPSLEADVPQAADTVEGLIARVNDLPIEEVLSGVSTLLQNVNTVVGSEAVQAAPDELLALVGDVRGLVGSDQIQEVPGEIATLLAELQTAVTDVREVLAEFRDAGAAEALTAALAQSAPTLETLNRLLAAAEPAVAELPALVERLGAAAADVAETAATVATLPLTDVVTSAADAAAAAQTLLASEAVQQVPVELSEALAQLTATLEEVREAGLVAEATAAIDAAGSAATQLAAATDTLPALIDRLGAAAEDVARLAATAADLPLSELATSAVEAANAAEALVASEAVQTIPQDISTLLAELESTLQGVREAGLVDEAAQAVDAAGDAAARLAEATEGLPQLVERIEEVAANVAALPLASAVGAAEQALVSANELISSEPVRALPAELNTALAELRAVVAEFREAELVAQVNGTLSEASRAAAAIREATAGVPAVVSGIEDLTATANALPLERLTNDLADLATATEALLRTEGAQQLPVSLNATLEEVQIALAELREGGLVTSANETLASARDAAAAIEQASESLPQLAGRLDALADQAERTLAGYDEGSELTREAQSTLREVQAAARAVSQLARQIERNPNSLLLGR